MSEELLDDSRMFGSYIIILMDICGEVVESERFLTLGVSPVALLGVHCHAKFPNAGAYRL